MKATVFACVTAIFMFLSGCSSVPIPGAGRYVYQADPPRTVNYPAPAVVAPPAPSGSAYAPPAYAPPAYGPSGPYVNQGDVSPSAQRQWSAWRTARIVSLDAAETAWTRITDKHHDSRDASRVVHLQKWWTARGDTYCARVRAARNGISDQDYRDRCHADLVSAYHKLAGTANYQYEGNFALRRALTRIGKGFEYPLFR